MPGLFCIWYKGMGDMKRLLAIGVLVCMAAQVQAKCADRYYYYEAKPTVLAIKKWNIYQDLSIQASKELQDIKTLNDICSETKGFRHNSVAYINYIVDANAWQKIKNPLYKNLTIQFPKGLFGDGSMRQVDINEMHQKNRKDYFQFQTEYKEGSRVSSVTVYIVRKGIDEMYTPRLHFSKNAYLQRDGYFYTEYKK